MSFSDLSEKSSLPFSKDRNRREDMAIKVIVAGFKGRMGSTAVDMVKSDEALELAALLDPFAEEKDLDSVPVFNDKEDLIGFDADVWVDFTMPKLLMKTLVLP